MLVDCRVGPCDLAMTLFVTMGDVAVAAEFSEQFVAIMDSNKVPERFRNFLLANNCTQVSDFAIVCAEEKLIASEIIEACEIGDLNFGEKLAIKKTWVACRASTFPGGAVVPSTAPSRSGPNKKLPDGVEDRLLGLWHARHKFHLPGSWLAKEGLVTEIYTGLHAPKKYLYVPAMEAIVRKSNLSQKPISGTLITESGGVEKIDYELDPCTTHPEFFLRFRAYMATICLCVVSFSDWFPLESMIEVTDFIFDSINLRPDGKRPSVQCLSACYMSMMGEYAKILQNHGTSFAEWVSKGVNWKHLWKESIVSFDGPDRGSSCASPSEMGVNIPKDLIQQMRTNENMMRSMKAELERRSSDKGGDDGYTGENAPWKAKNRRGWRGSAGARSNQGGQGGKGANSGNDNGGGKESGGKPAGAKRALSAGAKAWKKRSGGGKGAGKGGGKPK